MKTSVKHGYIQNSATLEVGILKVYRDVPK
jgi:hypothetical protein